MDNALQPSQPEADPAAAVFARLVEEVGVVRRLVAANDSTMTLGEIVLRLDTLTETIRVLSRRPAMALTPNAMAEQIATAARKARAEDHAAMKQAREQMEQSVRLMERQGARAVTARDQRRHLLWMGGGCLFGGALLWSFLPGTIARTAPESWHWPERMARHLVGEPSVWEAGTRMMRAENPDAWAAVASAATIWQSNQTAIDACESRAAKKGKTVCPLSD